jgi:predicted dehydrogenase
MVWLKQRIADGDFGTAHTIKAQLGGLGPAVWKEYTGDPRVFYTKSVGPLVDLGVYMLHAMTGLFGPATTVEAVGGIVYPERTVLSERFKGEVIAVETPDVMSVNLTFANSRFGHLYSSYATAASKAPLFELFGTHGAASVHIGQWYDGNGGTDIYLVDSDGNTSGWDDDVIAPNPLEHGGILESGVLHAFDVIERSTTSQLTAAHATHVLEIINSAIESAESGESRTLTTSFEWTSQT